MFLQRSLPFFQLPPVIAQLWCMFCPTHTVPRNHWRGTGMHQDLCCVSYQTAVWDFLLSRANLALIQNNSRGK